MKAFSFRQTLHFATASALSFATVTCLYTRHTSRGFHFEAYEGNGSDPRLSEAKWALEQILPIGSTLAQHTDYFKQQGGGCARVSDTARFPDEAVCWYSHWLLVSSEWKYVIFFQPGAERSIRTKLNFGLTGL